ncbi:MULTISPECIES: c-type cytochrome [unclassified Leisingera]|uniref:c-type cytochrome n=1 Tax=unclassified Leisingera TaxID=2614906 RepID=UPI0002D40AEE|nr:MULTISPECIES: cytochrome c [unclassified Leisingera]KIC22777.1 cytochrome C [Leisingera sp. ANG-S3]KIC51729.1 cytochrome C [Leisingera sp. ANG-S]KID08906.1 cytochrome C [Leisingera sp. ANG1]
MTLRRLKGLAFLVILAALAAGVTAPVTADSGLSKHVTRRMALMTGQKAAMDVLTGMMAGRIVFDRDKARSAQRQLIKSTGSIRKHFKKPRLDARSNARPLIWHSWKDFKTRAGTAEAAARNLSTRSLPALRRTLPGLMQSCLSCHETYRSTPNSFTTH